VSGPLLDRIDIHIEVPAVRYRELSDKMGGETSEKIKKRVDIARKVQAERFKGKKIHANAQMTSRYLKRFCMIDKDGEKLLEMAVDRLGLSARAYTRILKLSRTIADLEQSVDIKPHHISEAIQYRTLDRGVEKI